MKTEDMPEIAEGDHVRVVMEGEIHGLGVERFWLVAPGCDWEKTGSYIYPAEGQTVSIEKLTKPVKVGDILTGPELVAANLPSAALVRSLAESASFYIRFAGQWTEYDGDQWDDKVMQRIDKVEVVYLP